MPDFIGYQGDSYLIAPGSLGALALSCPDCGEGLKAPMQKYLESDAKHTFNCSSCKQVAFPVLEAHGLLWAACLEEWAAGFGEQVRNLRKFGVPVGRLKESPFITLHRELTEWNPVLGYACGWLDKGQLDFYLKDQEVQRRVGQSLTSESIEAAVEQVRKRKAAMVSSANLVSEESASNALELLYADAEALLALCAMLAQVEALVRTGDSKHHSEIADLTARCSIMRRVMSGKMKLPKGHTRLTYASRVPAAIAAGAMLSIKNSIETFARRSARD